MRISATWVIIAALLSALFCASASAQVPATVSATDPAAILELASAHGLATLRADTSGDPLITGRMDGIAYSIYFYGCLKHTNCKSVHFHSGFETAKKPELRTLNDWNMHRRWGRAFASKDGYPMIDMDVGLSYGLPRATMNSVFETWSHVVEEYARYIGYKARKDLAA